MSAPHFRIVYPARFRGQKHMAASGKIYVTFPGMTEFEFPAVRGVDVHDHVDSALEVTLNVVASCEIQYRDEEDDRG